MAYINKCLKRVFIAFNVLLAIAGAAIIALAVLAQQSISGDEVREHVGSIVTLYIIGSVTVVISILGAFGAYKENKPFLVIFVVTMVTGSLMMLRIGVTTIAERPMMGAVVEMGLDHYRQLDTAPSEMRDAMDIVQSQMHCCGLFGYTDWGQNIPDSCLCDREDVSEVLCTAVGGTKYWQPKKYVHSEPCGPIIRTFILQAIDITIGIIFTLAGLGVLGMVLSSVMIHQLNRAFRPTIKPHHPVIFTAPPPKYEELNLVKC